MQSCNSPCVIHMYTVFLLLSNRLFPLLSLPLQLYIYMFTSHSPRNITVHGLMATMLLVLLLEEAELYLVVGTTCTWAGDQCVGGPWSHSLSLQLYLVQILSVSVLTGSNTHALNSWTHLINVSLTRLPPCVEARSRDYSYTCTTHFYTHTHHTHTHTHTQTDTQTDTLPYTPTVIVHTG